ncbi:DUF3732 domain-containing protein [uncultured Fusobacterium sp.]|uniref:DUF3732 domain-containing protein n=1 Tax=uncultured Fusobacterium sp. TaxID=159267 RepID=UPI0027DDC98F|nr:DUF3732 domain-containing protein [uncultured Fusobacterium sp.]
MKASISRVIVFKKNYKKDEIKFTDGLNIITGKSQTGKSAILEIIDYCLLNSVNSIPHGVVTENVILYCIILVLKGRKIILARKPFKCDSQEKGRLRVFYNLISSDFNENELKYEYFEEKLELYRPISEVKTMLLAEFGVNVVDKVDFGDNNEHQISIRNIVSYIFQQQNLIANKYSLFYRFDDSFKRKSTIQEFPVLAGMVDQKYFQNKIELENLGKELKKLEKIINNKKEDYDINKMELEKLKEEFELLFFDKSRKLSVNEDNIDYKVLQQENENILNQIANLREKLQEINAQKFNLIKNRNYRNDINNRLQERLKPDFSLLSCCPICNSKLEKINLEIKSLKEKKEELVSIFAINNNDNFADIDKKIFDYKNKELELYNEINKLKNKNKENIDILNAKDNYKIMEIIEEKKIKISLLERLLNFDDIVETEKKYKVLEEKIKDIKENILEYDIDRKISEAQNKIGEMMSKLATELGFEKGLGNPNFKIDLKEFDVYQYFNNEKIFISSMGSGSNWLTVHLSLFLALNYYICTLGETSAIPTILLLDQPSQVYFPSVFNENSEDVVQVTKIYSVILKYINYTKRKTGIEPQIIVVDHADNLKIDKEISFDTFVRARWNEKEKGFITFN